MNTDSPVVVLLAAALLGLFGGFGLVIGAFVARTLRRYMRDELGVSNGNGRKPPE